MSGPQFANLQTYARKSNKAGNSVEQVIREGLRDLLYSMHVDHPRPPRILLGDPQGFQKLHDDHVAARAVEVKMKDGKVHRRAIRQDRHTMASVVMSYPVPWSAIDTDEKRARLAAWEARNMAFLKARYGGQLKVIFAHEDEEHPHLHAWLLPDDPGADATTLHPGKTAKNKAEAKAKAEGVAPREAVKLGNRAYKQAMTVWQDEYYEAVGAPEGLTRLGPNRQRLSRAQYRAQKNAAQATARYEATVKSELEGTVQTLEITRAALKDVNTKGREAVREMEANKVRAKAAEEAEQAALKRKDDIIREAQARAAEAYIKADAALTDAERAFAAARQFQKSAAADATAAREARQAAEDDRLTIGAELGAMSQLAEDAEAGAFWYDLPAQAFDYASDADYQRITAIADVAPVAWALVSGVVRVVEEVGGNLVRALQGVRRVVGKGFEK